MYVGYIILTIEEDSKKMIFILNNLNKSTYTRIYSDLGLSLSLTCPTFIIDTFFAFSRKSLSSSYIVQAFIIPSNYIGRKK